MMEDVITSGTGTLARLSSMPVAGKTGTTTDDKDLSFAGYTPYYVGGIWMGYDNPKRMSYDKSYHLLLWKDVMEQVHEGLEVKQFTQPNGIVTRSLCSVSGAQPSSLCAQDYFGSTVSTDICAADAPNAGGVCTVHQKVTICKDGLCKPGDHCPADSIIEVVLAIDPDTGEVMNNPEEGGIDLSKTCTFDHQPEPVENSDASLPGLGGNDGESIIGGNTTDPLPQTPSTETPDEETTGSDEQNQPSQGQESGGLPGLTGLPGLGGQ